MNIFFTSCLSSKLNIGGNVNFLTFCQRVVKNNFKLASISARIFI